MRLLNLQVQNFMSLGDVLINFESCRGRPAILTGENSAGKSTVIRAIYWLLTGDIVEGTPVTYINTFGRKDTIVKGTFEVKGLELCISRYRGHSKYKNALRLHYDEEECLKGSRNMDKQAFLYELLQVNPDSLKYSTLFAQGSTGISYLTDAGLKNILESLVSTQVYAKAQEEVKKQRRSVENSLARSDQKVADLKATIEKFKELKEEEEPFSSMSLLEVYRKFLTELLSYQEFKRENTFTRERMCWEELGEKKEELLDLKSRRKRMLWDYKRFQELLNSGQCPTCLQDLDSALDLEDEIEYLEKKLEEFNTTIEGREKHIEFLTRSYEVLSKNLYRYGQIIQGLHSRRKDLEGLLRDVKQQKGFKDKVDKQIEQAYSDIDNETDLFADFQEQKEIVDFWVEGFGPSGIRRHLIYNLLPELNASLNHFLTRFKDSSIAAKFGPKVYADGREDYDKISVIALINGIERPIGLLSGGQRRKVDLAFGWALNSLSGLNLLMLDEQTEFLDSYAREVAFRILSELARDKTVIVVGHDPGIDATHLVTMVNGISEVTEV